VPCSCEDSDSGSWTRAIGAGSGGGRVGSREREDEAGGQALPKRQQSTVLEGVRSWVLREKCVVGE